MPEVSIIIRTRDEERWIAHCLRAIAGQSFRDYEVVLVDNGSRDKTVARARVLAPDLRLVSLAEFMPGRAINEGVRASSGRYIVCLSAHCLPAQPDWLERLRANFDDPKLAGVYGRQIPMSFSPAQDKRDLLVTFGLDRRVQRRDPFFHNANSMVPRAVWDEFPFAEDVTNIEDRVWAQQVLDAGYHLVYEPEAAVFHHHGIHQNNDPRRAEGVVRVMEQSGAGAAAFPDPIAAEALNIVAVLPAQGALGDLGADGVGALLTSAVRAVQGARFVDKVIVSTSDASVAEMAARLSCAPQELRPAALSGPEARIDQVLQYELEQLETRGDYPDLLASLEITHPFRPPGLFDDLVTRLLATGVDTVMAGRAEYRPCWTEEADGFQRLDKFMQHRRERDPVHIGLPALGCVSLPHVIRAGSRYGRTTGIVELDDPLATLEVRDAASLARVANLLGDAPR